MKCCYAEVNQKTEIRVNNIRYDSCKTIGSKLVNAELVDTEFTGVVLGATVRAGCTNVGQR